MSCMPAFPFLATVPGANLLHFYSFRGLFGPLPRSSWCLHLFCAFEYSIGVGLLRQGRPHVVPNSRPRTLPGLDSAVVTDMELGDY